MKKKKVYALYRVSDKKQVDKNVNDIPMQKQASHDFIAAKQDWELYKEISELGISGFKVSAKDRDAILEIQKEALEGKFDVLLVFMFDRLGRKDDETPFIVEWFVKQGIEVWSVKEGEQRFDHHVDKLTNYIRYWQASGESIKTSIRTKTRLSQIVQEGHFRGGTAPYGYHIEKQGRFNKRNHELYEIMVDEEESLIVQKIFDLYVSQGYGSQRIASYLSNQGVMTHKGKNFTNGTINNMIQNRSYTGVLKSGDTVSDIFTHLQIIDPDTFEAAQKIKQSRSKKGVERTVPLNTRGNSLLSGNVFCGHCGGRLIITTNGKKYNRKDGEVTVKPRIRYVCYAKTRHKQCDGQTGYTAAKLDNIINEVVRRLFDQFNDLPKDSIIEQRYLSQIAGYKVQLNNANASYKTLLSEMKELEAEVLKVIRGESTLNSDLLNKLYEEAKEKVEQSKKVVRQIEEQIDNGEKMKDSLSKQFDNIKSWSDMYDECGMETRKMILSNIMHKVKVSRDYEIEIDMAIDFEDFGVCLNREINSQSLHSRASS